MFRGNLPGASMLALLFAAMPVAAQVEIDLISSSTPSAVFSGSISENGRWVGWKGNLYDRLTEANVLFAHQAGLPTTPPANNLVNFRRLSQDGRFVLYETWATDVAAGVSDTNDSKDVYLYDRNVATAVLISHAAGSPLQTAENESGSSWMSSDARRFVLQSWAHELLAGMTGAANVDNLFFRDRITGTTELISHSHLSLTEGADQPANFWAISADERYVYYSSAAFNLIADFVDHNDTETEPLVGDGRGGIIPIYVDDLYLYDRVTQQSTLISHKAGLPNHGSSAGVGRALPLPDQSGAFFAGGGDDLVAGQTPAPSRSKIFFWNRVTNTSELVTHAPGQPLVPCNGTNWLADLSEDGRYVLVTSTCALAGSEGRQEVYLIDRVAKETQLITHVPGDPSTPLGLLSTGVSISNDGRRVTFSIFDAPGQLGPYPYSYDRETGITTPLSPTWADAEVTARANIRSVSADGNFLVLNSTSDELSPGDTDGLDDIYLAVLSNIFADGFEGGSTAAWSQTLP